MRKRLLSSIVAIAMLTSSVITAVFAANPTIAVSSVTASAGETVDVTVSLDGNPGIAMMLLQVGYDSDALTLTKVTDAGVLGSQSHSNNLASNPYSLYWNNTTATDNFTATGTIATLTFAISSNAAAGEYPITVSYDNNNDDILDVDFDAVDFDVQNGSITVESDTPDTEPTIIVSSANASAGETVDVTVSLDGNPGIAMMLLQVGYDSDALTLTKVTDAGVLGSQSHSNNLASNPYSLYWNNTTATDNFTATGTIATLTFAISSNAAAGEYPITVSYDNNNDDILDVDFEAVDFDIQNGSITVENTTVSVTGISLDKTEVTITEGGTETLTATVSPENATDKTVTWTSSDETVATVADGVVTAVAAGTATITATTVDGEYTAGCAVTVESAAPVSNPTIIVSSANANAGETVDVTVSLENNPGIALMRLYLDYDSNAMTLTNVADAGVLGSQSHSNNLLSKPYILYWNNGTATENFTATGAVVTLTFAINDSAASGDYAVTISYDNNDDDILDVDFDAVDFDVQNGTISVAAIENIAVTSVSIDKIETTITVGETETLTATVSPENATNKTVTWTSSDETVATVSDGVVTAVAEGKATITVTTVDGEHTATCPVKVVNKQFEGITLADGSFTYDGTEKTLAVSGAPAGAAVNYIGNGQTDAGTYQVAATVTAAGYDDLTLNATLTILPKKLTVTGLQAVDRVYDGDVYVSLSGGELVGIVNNDEVIAEFPSFGTIQSANAGENIAVSISDFALTGAKAQNYTVTVPNDITVNIAKADLPLSFDNLNTTYNGEAQTIAPYSALPLPEDISFTYEPANSFTNAGTYTVTVTATAENYNDFQATATFTIAKAALTVKADSTSKEVGADDPALTYTYEGTLYGTDAFSGALTREEGDDVGSYAILQGTLTAGDNYEIAYEGATFTIIDNTVPVTSISLDKIEATITVGETETLTATVLPENATNKTVTWTSSDETVATVADGVVTAVSAGTAVITAAAGSGFTATYSVTVVNKQFEGITLADGSFTYDGTVKSLAVSGEPAGVTVNYIGNEQINAGTYQVTATVTAAGYDDLTLNATLTILPKELTVTGLQAEGKVYDGTTDAVITGGELVGTVEGDDVSANIPTAGTFAVANAGEGITVSISEITLTGESAQNYTITQPEGFTANITKAALTVKADSASKEVGADDPALTYTYEGNLYGADAFSGSLTREEGNDIGSYAILQGTLTAGDNYEIAYEGATFTINAISVTGISLDKTEATITVGGTETLVETVLPENATDKTVNWSSSDETVATVAGGVVTAVSAGTATITATTVDGEFAATCAVTVVNKQFEGITLADESFTYDGTEKSLAVSGAPAGATVNYSGNGQTNAGEYVVTVTVSAPDYDTVQKTAKLTIAKAALTVKADSASKEVGADDPTLTYTYEGTLYGTDAFSGALTREEGNDVGSYAILQGTLTAGDNYEIAYEGATFTINAIPVTGISITEEATIFVGKTYAVAAEISPENATNKTVTWTSSDETVATVADGVVTAVAEGTATITATTVDGSFEANCAVTVIPNPAAITVSNAKGDAGETVDVVLSISDNTGITAMQLNVDYDNEYLTLKSVTNGEIFDDEAVQYDVEHLSEKPYVLTWGADIAEENITSNGTLVTLSFEISENAPNGKLPITVTYDNNDAAIYNIDNETVDFVVNNGSVNVYDIGDVNNDGRVNAFDRTFLARNLANWQGYENDNINYDAADVDANGTVNPYDLIILSRYVAKWVDYRVLPYIGE